jgi:hypothetical protein
MCSLQNDFCHPTIFDHVKYVKLPRIPINININMNIYMKIDNDMNIKINMNICMNMNIKITIIPYFKFMVVTTIVSCPSISICVSLGTSKPNNPVVSVV